ncbi:MAG TPA: MarR family transcriptional regulator [Caulobacteraceae bacterium]|jgi:DNA-binding MarR family transcriptional regulator
MTDQTHDADGRERLRFWFRAFGAVSAMEREIAARLRERHGASLARFDLMAQLFAAPNGLRMGELTRKLLVTGGNVTGLVQRLEREGLVERKADEADRRIAHVALTPEGLALFKQMAQEHVSWVNELLAELDPRSLAQAAGVLEQVRRHLLQQSG